MHWVNSCVDSLWNFSPLSFKRSVTAPSSLCTKYMYFLFWSLSLKEIKTKSFLVNIWWCSLSGNHFVSYKFKLELYSASYNSNFVYDYLVLNDTSFANNYEVTFIFDFVIWALPSSFLWPVYFLIKKCIVILCVSITREYKTQFKK